MSSARDAAIRQGCSFDWQMTRNGTLECQMYDEDGCGVNYWSGGQHVPPDVRRRVEEQVAREWLEESGAYRPPPADQ